MCYSRHHSAIHDKSIALMTLMVDNYIKDERFLRKTSPRYYKLKRGDSFVSGSALDWLSSGISEYGALLRWMGADENAGYLDSDYSLEKASNERNVANFKIRLENLRDVLVKLK